MSPSRKSARSTMRPTMQLGDFLVAYLKRAGVRHIFGLPGDLVLGLFHRFGKSRDLDIVTFSHEPSVGFAADGYARSTRELGVVCVTYGAGGHNVVNATAGAYAEQVPLLIVSGGPGDAEQKVAQVHHQVKDVAGQSRIFSEVTCVAELVLEPVLAAEQIHRVVGQIMTEQRPGYLEIRRDMVDVVIPIPTALRSWKGSYPRPTSHERKLSEAVLETVERLRAAKRPVLIGGVELFRDRAELDFVRLAEKLGVPVVTTPLAKGVFPMAHPLHMGIYIGPHSHPAIAKRVHAADLVLSLGSQLTDLNLGASKPQIDHENTVWAVSQRVEVSYHQYDEVELCEFVSELADARLPRFRERVVYHDNLKRSHTRAKAKSKRLTINDMLVEVNDFLAEEHDYHVVAESGDMLFGGLEVRLHGKGLYLAQGYYASMGFAIPAAIGAQIGTGIRPLILCGDGGFQMTGPEISHAPKRGMSPLVVLVNNGGWGIFRPVAERQDLLDVPNWPYAELAQAWGGVGFSVTTAPDLRDALRAAHQIQDFALIECKVASTDLSPLGRRYIKGSAAKGRSRRK